MPITSRSNNRLLPPNSRTVDVARRSLADIIPVQQLKYANAFKVQGFETIVYHRLHHGQACSCQNSRGASATYLDQEGKMHPGTMDSLLQGGLEFRVNRYGGRSPTRPDLRTVPSRFEDGQVLDGDEYVDNPESDVVSDDLNDPMATTVTSEDAMGVNGRSSAVHVDDDSVIFDAEARHNDTRCAICFGSGFQGGFSILNGQRIVLTTQSKEIAQLTGTIECNQTPHAFACSFVEFNVVLPRGAMAIDSFRVWNNDRPVYPSNILIDGLPCTNPLLLALCNGRSHVLSFSFNAEEQPVYFTHVELQLNLSSKPALFEYPKKVEGSDMAKIDGTEEMGLNASPEIPKLQREDVLTESVYGKALIVNSCTPWNDRGLSLLGWDVQTRVIQPEELLNLLPRRNVTHQKTTLMIRENGSGTKRN